MSELLSFGSGLTSGMISKSLLLFSTTKSGNKKDTFFFLSMGFNNFYCDAAEFGLLPEESSRFLMFVDPIDSYLLMMDMFISGIESPLD